MIQSGVLQPCNVYLDYSRTAAAWCTVLHDMLLRPTDMWLLLPTTNHHCSLKATPLEVNNTTTLTCTYPPSCVPAHYVWAFSARTAHIGSYYAIKYVDPIWNGTAR